MPPAFSCAAAAFRRIANRLSHSERHGGRSLQKLVYHAELALDTPAAAMASARFRAARLAAT